jgi:hypothetical protein
MKIKLLLPLSISLLMFACAPSTKLVKTWADPSFNASTTKPYTKILVVSPGKDAVSQRVQEDKIVAQLKHGVGVASYTYLTPTDTDQSLVEIRLIKDGFDGVIMMRLKEVEKTTSYTPGTSYGGWYGYRNYTPGYYSEDQTFQVETNFYSLPGHKLLWSGITATLNPKSLESTIDQIIGTIKFELQKKGFLKK